MSRSKLTTLFGATGRMLVVCVLVLSQSAWALQDQPTKDRTKAPQNSAVERTGAKPATAMTTAQRQTEGAQGEASENSVAQEKSGDPSHQSIKVHGHWTIDVRNPDGTLVTHREFENSLLQGEPLLSSFLARAYSVGTWVVTLMGNVCLGGAGSNCGITEPLFGPPTPGTSFNTLAVSASGANFILIGTATAPLSGAIQAVQTQVQACPATTPVSSPCTYANAHPIVAFTFTATNLATPLQVLAGQTIAVTVTISFS